MVLESTMICVDDSDYMRNGDFTPTRMAAMQDAVQLICNAKTRQNPENNVGLLTLASSEVLSTLTTDPNKLMSKLLAVQPEGDLKFMSGLRVAHLALKHRQGKNHRMRIIVFIGSPLGEIESAEIVRLAKKFKKEKVNVDIISFGDGNSEMLQRFIDTLNGEDGTNSHLVNVNGPSLTSTLVSSPVLVSEDGVNMAGAAGGNFDFGIDPNDDPELALALRVSMEEQRARQEADSRNAATESGTADSGTTHEEQMLEQALAMSMGSGGSSASAGAAPSSSGASISAASVDFSSMTEEEQIAYALQMSMQDSNFAAAGTSSQTATAMESEGADAAGQDVEMKDVEEDYSPGVDDTAFLQQVLESLPEGGQVKQETVESAKTLVDKDKDKSEGGTSASSSTKSGSTTKKSPGSGGNEEKKKKPEPKK